MDSIGDLIGKRLNQHHLGQSARAALIVDKANALISQAYPASEKELKALSLKDGTLYIGVAGAVWNQEIWAYKEKLMREIQKEYGEKSIRKVLIKSLTSN